MDLYLENGNKAGPFDIARWWISKYPPDIFIKEPSLFIKIRDLLILVLKKEI